MGRRAIVLISLLGIMLGLAACGSGKSSSAQSTNNAASKIATAAPMEAATAGGTEESGAVPNCGAVQAVWVNLNSKVYHEPGDPMYGKTMNGKYMCPSAAKAQGFRPSGGALSHRHKAPASQM